MNFKFLTFATADGADVTTQIGVFFLLVDGKKKEKEEYDKKHCLILGLADLTSKNSARDFMERAK